MPTENNSVSGAGNVNNNGNAPSVATPAGSAVSASKSGVQILPSSEPSVATPTVSVGGAGDADTPISAAPSAPAVANSGGVNNNGNAPSVATPAGSAVSASKSDVQILPSSEPSVATPTVSVGGAGDADTPISAAPSAPAVANSGGVNNNDPNDVKVNIRDKETPIVLLYGPPACGKTMILVRLSRYLREKGYTVDPEKSFRDSRDSNYQLLCDNFGSIIDSNTAAASTSNMDFMLLRVLDKNSRPICQILEAPGEGYYNPDSHNSTSYPPYVHEILNSNNRKIFVIILDAEKPGGDPNYVQNIRNLKREMDASKGHKSEYLFVYNKIDVTPEKTAEIKTVKKRVEDLYPGIFAPFKNDIPIMKWHKPYNCGLVRFSSGNYNETSSGSLRYTPSSEQYPRDLWKKIQKLLRG